MAKSWECPKCGHPNKNRRDVCNECCTRRDEYVPDRRTPDPDVLRTARVAAVALARGTLLEVHMSCTLEQYREAFNDAFLSND